MILSYILSCDHISPVVWWSIEYYRGYYVARILHRTLPYTLLGYDFVGMFGKR